MRILSGVFEGRTTGTPISLMIENVDQRSKDYSDVAKAYRPGHADYAYDAKYGFRDFRGGGRSSARETAARVAAGGVARLIMPEVSITAYVVEIGVPVVRPSNTPERMRTSSGSCRCVVKRDVPGRRLSRNGWRSASDNATPGGQPSTIAPSAGPWLSPHVVKRNTRPNVLKLTRLLACGGGRPFFHWPARQRILRANGCCHRALPYMTEYQKCPP